MPPNGVSWNVVSLSFVMASQTKLDREASRLCTHMDDRGMVTLMLLQVEQRSFKLLIGRPFNELELARVLHSHGDHLQYDLDEGKNTVGELAPFSSSLGVRAMRYRFQGDALYLGYRVRKEVGVDLLRVQAVAYPWPGSSGTTFTLLGRSTRDPVALQ